MKPHLNLHPRLHPRLNTALAAVLMLSALGGCATAVPTIPPAVPCDVPANLMQACDAPALLEPGAHYRDLIRQAMTDRQALVQCGGRQQALARAVDICRRAVEQHNTELQAIDARLKAAR